MPDPYLSIVVTARNDDHGGNLLGRMQAFVNNWLGQARRFQIASELIIVEWNPPHDRPSLAQALRWPSDRGPCDVRIIEVSPELHRRLAHADALPLYQMIGKNVGIRRARGEFILATNIDVLFSSELAAFLAEQKLDPARMYRIDRHDTASDVPVDAHPQEQLEYCRTHLIRINRREGTFPVVAHGLDALQGQTPDARIRQTDRGDTAERHLETPGVRFGDGWFPVERYGKQEIFRWAGKHAAIGIDGAPSASHALVMEVEPGPGTDEALILEISTTAGAVGAVTLAGRCRLVLRGDWRTVTSLQFEAKNELSATEWDARSLAFRVIRTGWRRWGGRRGASVERLSVGRRAAILRDGLTHLAGKLAHGGPVVTLTLFVSPRIRNLLRHFSPPAAGAPIDASPRRKALSPEFLHTNGCGDFTLLAREKWLDLRGYPELDLFSMNLDSVFCYAAHHGGAREAMLEDPMRIYHIEHGSGSGWTPEGQAKLFQRIEALGLSYVDNDTVLSWAAQMREFDAPMIFNHQNWGFAEDELRETVPVRAE